MLERKIKSDNGTITTCGKETYGQVWKRCYAVTYRGRRYTVLSPVPQVQKPVRGGVWWRMSPTSAHLTLPAALQGSKPAILPPHAPALLPTLPVTWAHPSPCPSPISALSNPQETLPSVFAAHPQLLFSLKVTWRRLILLSDVPSTHSRKYLPVNNYVFQNQIHFENYSQHFWKPWHLQLQTLKFWLKFFEARVTVVGIFLQSKNHHRLLH